MTALGVGPRRLGRLVMLEAAFLGLLGALIGMALGLVLVAIIGQTGISFAGLEEMTTKFGLPGNIYPQFSLLGTVAGPGFVYLASLLASIYPALRLRFLQPVDAMRSA